MRPLLRSFLVLSFLAMVANARATHNEAGEIYVCFVNGLTYQVTIVTYTNPASPADRPYFAFNWGDGTALDTIPRDTADTMTLAGQFVQHNVYLATHTFPGPGVYTVSYLDPNRVAGVMNIPNSVNVPMFVQSQITVLPGESDCLPRFTNPPIQNACLFHPWYHNPGAYDTDGDSLSYEATPCLTGDPDNPTVGYPIPGYQFPNEVSPGADSTYSIDPITGTISWISPQEAGIYNIAFVVKEWRHGVMIGYVERDMQVIVTPCNDQPPAIDPVPSVCVVEGTTVQFSVHATDPDAGQTVTLSALGAPFEVLTSPASFPTVTGSGSVTGTFTWHTICDHVRLQPYQALFKASDNFSPVQLQYYTTANITVVAPAPQNPTVTPDVSVMRLHWDTEVCSHATGYLIYRRQGSYGFTHGPCETGVPAYTGYQYIGQTTGLNSTDYTDNGLAFGITYCYMVVAVFPDGAQSYASVEFCAMLQRSVPIMLKASVGVTDVATGIDTVGWSTAWDLDTAQHPGPYRYKLYRGSGFSTANNLIHTGALSNVLQDPDTTFIDNNINTQDNANVYRVELYGSGGDSLIGSGNTASSVFLTAVPNDQQITLHFNQQTPWIVDSTQVWRQNSGTFDYLGTSLTTQYIDSGLVNGQQYCYYAIAFGAYSDSLITRPLINYSQRLCATPIDLTPPCPPTLAINSDCNAPLNTLRWTDPDNSCADDVYHYNIYYRDSIAGPFHLIATITGASDTVFTHVNGNSIAGCYAVTAIDTAGNESLMSDTICTDNCPLYTLPNVFSPNHDDHNDFFVPFPYRGVKEIDLRIFNRWGNLLFSTTDPAIKWNGTSQSGGGEVPDGVYFYVCQVTYIYLAGPQTVELKGYVHILRGGNGGIN